MRVERQGHKIQVVLKEGNQERWFTIEESEARELADRLAAVIATPKSPKFVVGDRVRVIEDDRLSGAPAGTILTVENVLDRHAVSVLENEWVWYSGYIELVEPLKFKVGDWVRVIKADETFYNHVSRVKAVQSNGNVQLIENTWFAQDWLEKVER